MHASWSQVIEIIMSQGDSADEDSDNTAHIEQLSDDIAQDPEHVDDDYLSDFAGN
jgi:hypothetical protein